MVVEIFVEDGEHMDTLPSVPYHLRASFQEDEIRIAVMDKESNVHTVIIKGARPILGHVKTGECS